MNIEAYTYSILSSVLGILIVFIALIVLSVMMVVLKRAFDRNKVKAESAEQDKPKDGMVVQKEEELDWLTAAVTAYMVLEQEASGAPSAENWNPGGDERIDPWVSTPVLRTHV